LNVLNKGYSVDAKLSRYKPGQDYQWHCDQDAYSFNKSNPNWKRVISLVTYLNEGYEGGETEFESGLITPASGKTVVFPSFFLYPHRGTPVITGVKYLLVMHVWT
jgi:predicted 2-oxoglutarate/Fe(II)-dependent dioxygenase YbiX